MININFLVSCTVTILIHNQEKKESIIRLPKRKILKEMLRDKSGELVLAHGGLKGSGSHNFVTAKLRRSSAGAEKGLICYSLH